MRELALRIVEMAEEEAHGLTRQPVLFVDGARPYVFGLEGFYEVAELGV